MLPDFQGFLRAVSFANALLKRNHSVCGLAFLLLCHSSFATSVMVIITPQGIVIAADSLLRTRNVNPATTDPPNGTTDKIAVVHDRIAVGNVGLAGPTSIISSNGSRLFGYDSALWFREIEEKTAKDISVSSLVGIVEDKSRSTFSPLNNSIQSGALKRDQASNLPGFQYLVAGYEAGIAVIQEVNFYVDWENRQLIGPITVPIFPNPQTRRNDFGVYAASMGYKRATAQVLRHETDSAAYRSVASETILELPKLYRGENLSLDQASTLLHAFLRAEHKNTPDAVGPPYCVIWLLKDGTWKRFDYLD